MLDSEKIINLESGASMKLTALFILAVPTLAMAQNKLPDLKEKQEICYARAYSVEYQKKNPSKKLNGVAVGFKKIEGRVYSSIYVTPVENGPVLSNSGAILTLDGSRVATLPASKILAQMDDDGGRFVVAQDAKNKNTVLVKIEGVSVSDDYEGEKYIEMNIDGNGVDSTHSLRRVFKYPNDVETCRDVLAELVHMENS